MKTSDMFSSLMDFVWPLIVTTFCLGFSLSLCINAVMMGRSVNVLLWLALLVNAVFFVGLYWCMNKSWQDLLED